MNDVFISYEHESKAIADNICAVLEKNKVRCFYAPRDIQGDYATSIVEAIRKSKVFILVLNELASNSIHVLNEVEQAHEKLRNKEDMYIIPFKMDNETLSLAMGYYVKRLHWIDASNNSIDLAIEELKKQVMIVLKIDVEDEEMQPSTARATSKFYTLPKKERIRLTQQKELLKKFDQNVYDEIFNTGNPLTVLDVGSNDGSLIIDRIADKNSVSRIIGLEFDANVVDECSVNHPKYTNYQCDVEANDFKEVLSKIMEENDIEKVDVINISMLLLHLKNPQKLLRILRGVLKPKGRIIIKDIDDGLNMAYPDDNKWFDRIYDICDKNETSGYRKTGRQIHSFLKKSGFNDIKLEAQSLNTIGMDYDDKQAFFEVYFSFILGDIKIMHGKYPSNQSLQEECEWYTDTYDSLEEHFQRDDFMFSLGFMMYTATK